MRAPATLGEAKAAGLVQATARELHGRFGADWRSLTRDQADHLNDRTLGAEIAAYADDRRAIRDRCAWRASEPAA